MVEPMRSLDFTAMEDSTEVRVGEVCQLEEAEGFILLLCFGWGTHGQNRVQVGA